ncbi:prepilin-type N-terminal cleavage/methylation domain-containing protein [bacterium]|nr:prepilin-type N-terminal cleavage/methylation domain-containing protein [bacterium]
MKKAFSLSELLLALGIISVIATFMITTVIPLGDEKKNKTLANKALLTLEEAYALQITNDSGRDASELGKEFLLSRMTSGANPVLPIYEASGNAVQLPNGMIIYNDFGELFVDVDGSEGETRSTLSNPPRACGNADILRFFIDGSEIIPDYNCGNAAEYFDYDGDVR